MTKKPATVYVPNPKMEDEIYQKFSSKGIPITELTTKKEYLAYLKKLDTKKALKTIRIVNSIFEKGFDVVKDSAESSNKDRKEVCLEAIDYCKDVRDIYKNELKRKNITEKHRLVVYKEIADNTNKIHDLYKDLSEKGMQTFNTVYATVGAGMLLAVLYGLKILFGKDDSKT